MSVVAGAGKDGPSSEEQELEMVFETQRVCRASWGSVPPDALWGVEMCSSSLGLVQGVLTRERKLVEK